MYSEDCVEVTQATQYLIPVYDFLLVQHLWVNHSGGHCQKLREDAVKFVEPGNYFYTTTHIIMKVFIKMFATGLYKDKCRAWNQLLVPARTWLGFNALLIPANKEMHKLQALSNS